MRTLASRGRLVWSLSGVLTAVMLAVPGTRLLVHTAMRTGPAPQATATRTFTVKQPVTSVAITSSGSPVRVMAAAVTRVRVTEVITYPRHLHRVPVIPAEVSGGHLTLSDHGCPPDEEGCLANVVVTVPLRMAVSVTTNGGPLWVDGTGQTTLNSGGGFVQATHIDGPLTALAGGGPVQVRGLTGDLNVNTGGGSLIARGISAAIVSAHTDGGPATIALAASPQTVTVWTGGGAAMLSVPDGPYALTATTDGGSELIGIATDPAAAKSIMVTTSSGPLTIEPG